MTELLPLLWCSLLLPRDLTRSTITDKCYFGLYNDSRIGCGYYISL